MKELQQAMLSKLLSLHDEVISIDDKEKRKLLLKNNLQDIPQTVGGSRATNLNELLTYFMELNHYDIESMIDYLNTDVKNNFDIATMQREKEDDFDGMYGTRTSIIMSQFELPEVITPDRLFFAARFHPSPVRTVRFALDTLGRSGLRYEDFVFIDIGTGTGRNLLLAADYPFKQITGVEISSFLYGLAVENIRQYNTVTHRAQSVSVHCMDVQNFDLPDENLVLYFWEPFKEDVADPFIQKLKDLITENNRHVKLVFLQSVFQCVKNGGFFTCTGVFESPDIMDEGGRHFTITIYERKPLTDEFIFEF